MVSRSFPSGTVIGVFKTKHHLMASAGCATNGVVGDEKTDNGGLRSIALATTIDRGGVGFCRDQIPVEDAV